MTTTPRIGASAHILTASRNDIDDEVALFCCSAQAFLARTGTLTVQRLSCSLDDGGSTGGAELHVLGDPGPGLQASRLVQTV